LGVLRGRILRRIFVTEIKEVMGSREHGTGGPKITVNLNYEKFLLFMFNNWHSGQACRIAAAHVEC
jgi:hypothetical protein